jgi:hypothetical protein
MDSLLASVNALRAVPRAPWRDKVKRVAVVLTSSRSGSTLFKAALACHPDIAALDGEAEPYLALSGNGFGHDPACSSDAIAQLANADALADNIFDGLTIAAAHFAPLAELQQRWSKRLLLQFPALFATREAYARLQHTLAASLGSACQQQSGRSAHVAQQQLARTVLGSVFGAEGWRLDYYDGKIGPGAGRPFAEAAKIEEPPFVLPDPLRRRCTEADAAGKVLLFKTPSDAYRPGLYRQLFPNADVCHIHLTRGYAQSVNGLIDGWLSPAGFFAHDMARAGAELAIEGYSNVCEFGRRWWKFDLPPNWPAYAHGRLELVCLNQWLSCHRHILDSGAAAHRLAFEDFLSDPAGVLARVCGWLDLPPLPSLRELPVTMATEAPRPGRWRQRRALLEPLAQLPAVADTMRELGYRAGPEAWL